MATITLEVSDELADRLGPFRDRVSEIIEPGLRQMEAGARTEYEHVQIDASGTPVLAGTTMKVIELVTAQIAYGWSPEELHFQHPYLTLGQIHSALAYYWDHKETLDAEIERRQQWAEQARREARPSPLVAKLRAQGHLA